jgi:hypothetical protein
LIAAANKCPHFAILTPQGAMSPHPALGFSRDKTKHAQLLREAQRLRGRVALHEGAITSSELTASGRYVIPGDEKSWHVLSLCKDARVVGCARILVHPRNVAFTKLRIAAVSVSRSTAWAHHVKDAVEAELAHARRYDMTPIEPGAWVVDESLRGTREAVSIAMSAFAWAQILGGCVGFLTATVKHGSSTMLRRLGGRSLQAGGQTIPAYFEPAWGCNVELLRFDTNSLAPRFDTALAAARHRLLASPVFSDASPWQEFAPRTRNSREGLHLAA